MSTLQKRSRGDQKRSWGEAFSALVHPRVISMLFLGFSAGIPILLIFSTLSVWLREAEVSRSAVTFFSWAALGYSFKYIWAPLVDRLPVPVLTRLLGRRRGWLITAQFSIILSILWMAASNPAENLLMMALAAVVLGFSSATQDIVIDAYRIESADQDLQAMMSSAYIGGYRIGMIVAGAGALMIAGWFGTEGAYTYSAWLIAYGCMAAIMGVGVLTTLFIREPDVPVSAQSRYFRHTSDYLRFLVMFLVAVATFAGGFVYSAELANDAVARLTETGVIAELAGFIIQALRLILAVGVAALAATALVKIGVTPAGMVRESYVAPFTDFVDRYGKTALVILCLIGLYRISDIVMGVIANVFYTDLGFSKEEIAHVSKTFGLFMTIAGSFLGGILSVRYGVVRILFVGALLSAATNILFSVMAQMGPHEGFFIAVIIADNLSGGLATAAFIAFLSSLTSVAFTAMQYALFSSIMTLIPKVIAGYSGMMVDSVGYSAFFIGTAIIGIPVLFLVVWAGRLTDSLDSQSDTDTAAENSDGLFEKAATQKSSG